MLADYIKKLVDDGYQLVFEKSIDFNIGPTLLITLSKDRRAMRVNITQEDFCYSNLSVDDILTFTIKRMEEQF